MALGRPWRVEWEEPGLSPPPPRVSVWPLSLGFSRTGDQCQEGFSGWRNLAPRRTEDSDGHVIAALSPNPLVDQVSRDWVFLPLSDAPCCPGVMTAPVWWWLELELVMILNCAAESTSS